MKTNKRNIIFILLSIFYLVGIVGILIPSARSNIISYTPFNLILTAVLFVVANGDYSAKFFFSAFVVFIIGLAIEIVGVNTGLLFGDYFYGEPLGFKLFNTPLLIGVNWFILSFAAVGIFKKYVQNRVINAILSALLLVGLDFIIEPVAMQLSFWSWGEVGAVKHEVPTQNYAMWFLVALGISDFINYQRLKIQFEIAVFVILLQFAFFGILNLGL